MTGLRWHESHGYWDGDEFDWEAIDQEQGRFEGEVMVFLWFRAEDNSKDRRRARTVLQKALVPKCVQVQGKTVRVIAEISPEKKPMSVAHAIWLSTMTKVELDRN